ncbi:MAG: SIS domain-containing protein [Chloroflexota bacterium]|nr:MAG: SIS domain-containing protein [Chloroflexota bacterium]
MSLLGEIHEQPEAAARFLDRRLADVRAAARRIAAHDPAVVLVAARGSSDHAAIYAQYAFGLRNRLPVALAAPSMFSVYGAPPRLERSVVLGVSQSGESPDIVAVLVEARRQGAPAVAITNEPGSPLASAADAVIALEAGPERSVAATKTYTIQLLAIAALSAALAEPSLRDAERRLRTIPAAIGAMLDADATARDLAARHAPMTRAVVLGRGCEYPTAREWALKIQELTQVMAHAWSSADFAHGPLALVEPGLPVLAVVPDDAAGDGLVAQLLALRDDHRADVVTISRRQDARAAGFAGLPFPDLPPDLAPIASIVPGQLFALHLAVARGLNPDRPRTISKVTRTR